MENTVSETWRRSTIESIKELSKDNKRHLSSKKDQAGVWQDMLSFKKKRKKAKEISNASGPLDSDLAQVRR